MRHTSTADMAIGRWRSILPALGVPASALSGRHCACPMCGGRDRFRFDDREGRGSYICSRCGAGDGIDLVVGALGMSKRDAMSRIDELLGSGRDLPRQEARPELTEQERIERALRVWRGAVPITPGDVAHTYLASRGLDDAEMPASMRYFSDGERHMMVAGIQSKARALVGLQRTILTPEGVKVERRMVGIHPAGSAVRTSPPQELLGVAEGLETALSASALWGFPVWAALSADRLRDWEPPEGCREVVIFGDNDESFTGQAAAYGLARRMRSRELSVEVMIPDATGDWADVYEMRRAAKKACGGVE